LDEAQTPVRSKKASDEKTKSNKDS